MIFRDCTSLNLQNYTDKSGKVDTPEILKHKFTTHFKDIFGILSNNYIDMNNLQLLAQNLQAQYNLPTYVDF